VYVLYTARRLTYSAFQRCIEHTQSNEEKHLKTSLRCLSGTFQYTVPTSGTERFLTGMSNTSIALELLVCADDFVISLFTSIRIPRFAILALGVLVLSHAAFT
jgi:hypothetical protein